MYTALRTVLDRGEYSIVESFMLPPRPARHLPIPRSMFDCGVGSYLDRTTDKHGYLWAHQALALNRLGEGANIIVSTGTASGKSLIFRAAAFRRVLLDPSLRVIVFYPLKALAADQLRGWQIMAEQLGLSPDTVGRIDGSVPPNDRDLVLRRSRIVVMTPDVCHAWMMARLAAPEIRAFLRDVGVLVLDEAHALEGVFGSNLAFLVRRLVTARRLLKSQPDTIPVQFVVSTATIANPQSHLNSLTGAEFDLVSDIDDGSPQAERYCVHLATPRGDEMHLARSLHTALLRESAAGTFITFVDSRKGVEVLARASQAGLRELLADDAVMPYRAGYDSKDREQIESRLRNGTLRGVVSTSALELGIDLPDLVVGLNIGVPATRKAYRQRLGRVGRIGQGAFLVIAPLNAFTRYGTTFGEYHQMSVEPSYLYLDNRFMQFAHARCLTDELDALGCPAALPAHAEWPDGFREVFSSAKPGGDRPPEFDAIAQLGGDSPQRSYPLRNVGELTFKIALGENADAFGEVNESQALRECYPGAVYLHLARPFEVVAWNTNALRPYIKVRPAHGGKQTQPRIRTWINAGITHQDLLDGHLRAGASGFLAECHMQVTERVEGFTELQSGEFRSYQDLRQRNPNMRPRMRNFRTSGVVLCVNADWFKQSEVKGFVADRLVDVFSREYSVSPQDVGSAAANISLRGPDRRGPIGNCVAVFDQTYGSLRLTERLFVHFGHLLDRLWVAAGTERGADREHFENIVNLLRQSYEGFAEGGVAGIIDAKGPERTGYLHVFTPGSRVCLREKGAIATDVEILQPTIIEGKLMYQVKCPPRHAGMSPPKRWVNADFLEPSAEAAEWDYGWWNVETESYEEPPDDVSPPG